MDNKLNWAQTEIKERISELIISCPECENIGSDDQYMCGTCGSQGGSGIINVLIYLTEHPHILQTNKPCKNQSSY